jgi:hypothetical protein
MRASSRPQKNSQFTLFPRDPSCRLRHIPVATAILATGENMPQLLQALEPRVLFSTIAGDANLDGKVDLTDFSILAANFNKSSGATWQQGDFNGDGKIDLTDFTLLASQFNKTSTIGYSAPIIITKGGTYTGNWQSSDPNTPAVRVRTTEPVTIVDSNVKGPGDLIVSDADHTDITVRNTHGYGVNPNVARKAVGRFFSAELFDSAVLENNDLESTAGIYLNDFRGSTSASDKILVRYNLAHNIDGRKSNGSGGYLDFNDRTSKSDGHSESGYDIVQFLQLANIHGISGIEVAWNQVTNDPGASRVEDNISIYKSSGASSSPIRIHDNYIDGAYTIKPWQASTSDSSWTYDWSYSGGGIMLGDGVTGDIATSCGYVQAYNNTIVDTTNYGINITSGHDLTFYNNRIISDGLLDDGRAIAAQNVGAGIWNANGEPSSRFFNNTGHDNLIGWGNVTSYQGRNDWWVPDASSWVNNTHYSGTVTHTTELSELTLWQQKLTVSAVQVGPTS